MIPKTLKPLAYEIRDLIKSIHLYLCLTLHGIFNRDSKDIEKGDLT